MPLLIPEQLCANSFFFSNHFPPVDTPLQRAVHPDFDASVWAYFIKLDQDPDPDLQKKRTPDF